LVCSKAGVDFSCLSSESFLVAGTKEEEFECGVCFDDKPGDQMMSLSCRHFICLDCWKNYLHAAINQGPSCLLVSCPFPKCNISVNESVVSQTVDMDHKNKYEKFLSRSFVDDNPKIRWCPAPNCGKAIYSPDASKTSVQCSCGNNFCFKCNQESHSPASCEQMKLWKKKASDESETGNYLVANTKDCPKCGRNIEKNGGCNHMTCTQCKYEFCWVCIGEWKKLHGTDTGGYYQCNRFKEEDLEKLNKKNFQNARAALEKYMHYFQRFQNHERSLKLELKLKEKSLEKIEHLQTSSTIYSSWIDIDYVENAVEQLIQCRTILKYSYVCAYYLEDVSEKNLFEYLQEQLEKNTEKLSGILEGDAEYSREEILSLTKSANTRLNHLVNGVQNGLTITL
jgi:ariadne-1